MDSLFTSDIIELNIRKRQSVSSEDLLLKIVELETLENVAEYYSIGRKLLRDRLKQYLVCYDTLECRGNRTLRLALLEQLGSAYCSHCGSVQDLSMFHNINTNRSGIRYVCKTCSTICRDRDYHIKYSRQHYLSNKAYYLNKRQQRRFAEKRAITTFGNTGLVDFYKNCPDGYHVDHIIPITHKLVCGLHNMFNLQYLPAVENLQKGNKFEVT